MPDNHDFDGMRHFERGYPVRYSADDDAWYYFDSGESVYDGPRRPCRLCERPSTREGYDACLGFIEGARDACCGHGKVVEAYISWKAGDTVRFDAALALFAELGIGPPTRGSVDADLLELWGDDSRFHGQSGS
jgi:hypothetical protein